MSVLWDRLAKSAGPTKQELMEKFRSDYTKTADRMVDQLLSFAPQRAERRGS
jgi:hypothetical protein